MLGGVLVADGQIRHTTPYHTSLRPPMSVGGLQRKDTPPSELSYSHDRDTGADGGPEKENLQLFANTVNAHQLLNLLMITLYKPEPNLNLRNWADDK